MRDGHDTDGSLSLGKGEGFRTGGLPIGVCDEGISKTRVKDTPLCRSLQAAGSPRKIPNSSQALCFSSGRYSHHFTVALVPFPVGFPLPSLAGVLPLPLPFPDVFFLACDHCRMSRCVGSFLGNLGSHVFICEPTLCFFANNSPAPIAVSTKVSWLTSLWLISKSLVHLSVALACTRG